MKLHPLTVILNSGTTQDEKAKLAEEIAKVFSQAGGSANIITTQAGEDFSQASENWVKKAQVNGNCIVAAGGDGTINSVASLCYRYGVALGIIPLGTFNYFARELSIPTTIPEAVNIILAGHTRKVSVGLVREHIFLNNASFGLYTKLIREREKVASRFGRARLIAALAAAFSLLHRQKLFSVKINTDEQEKWHHTSMVFVGNNTLQLENLGMEVADCTKQDKLAIILMKETTRMEIARLLLRGAIRNLKDESRLKEFCADSFEVETSRKVIDLVIDGEIICCHTPLKFRVEKNALSVVVPAKEVP